MKIVLKEGRRVPAITPGKSYEAHSISGAGTENEILLIFNNHKEWAHYPGKHFEEVRGYRQSTHRGKKNENKSD